MKNKNILSNQNSKSLKTLVLCLIVLPLSYYSCSLYKTENSQDGFRMKILKGKSVDK